MKQKSIDLFAAHPLFAGCNREALTAFLKEGERVSLAAGESFDGFGDALCLLERGRAAIRAAGRGVILRTLSAGDAFGAASLFCPGQKPHSHIEAKSAATLYLYTRTAVERFLQTDAAFLSSYLSFLAGRVSYLNRRIGCFTAGSAEQRVALWLIAEEKNTLTLPPLSSLSEMLDIGRASLYRALDRLAEEKLIIRKGHTLVILDRDLLQTKFQS